MIPFEARLAQVSAIAARVQADPLALARARGEVAPERPLIDFDTPREYLCDFGNAQAVAAGHYWQAFMSELERLREMLGAPSWEWSIQTGRVWLAWLRASVPGMRPGWRRLNGEGYARGDFNRSGLFSVSEAAGRAGGQRRASLESLLPMRRSHRKRRWARDRNGPPR